MIAIHLDRVTVTYISQPVFQDLSWEIHTNRCAGLVGPNGCGKSTLLKLLVGDISSDSGFVVRPGNLSVGYLAQDPELDPDKSVWAEALSASPELNKIDTLLTEVEEQLSDPLVYGDEKKLSEAIEQQAKLLDRYAELEGPTYESRVQTTLEQLG